MKKFYEVVAKCGHVGKNRYYEGVFYEVAENGSQAATIVRGRGRVKHDHKDAILSVRNITREEFIEGRKQKNLNPYFNCFNKQQQDLCWEVISQDVRFENRYTKEIDENYQERRKNNIQYKKNKMKQSIRSYQNYLNEDYVA